MTKSRNDIGIERMGNYLLKGWVLTDLPCDRCNIPTMRTKSKSKVGFCCLCDDEISPIPLTSLTISNNVSNDVELQEIETLNSEFNNQTLVDNETFDFDSPEMMEKREENDRVTALLGKKLLQGWTMLQDNCPTCSIPLMRTKTKDILCVGCEKKYILQANGSLDEVKSKVEPPKSAPVPKNSVDILEPTDTEGITKRLTAETNKFDFKKQKMEVEQSSNDSSLQVTLKAKLDMLNERLKSATYPDEIISICNAVESCAKALASLNKI
ncbi:hypothetical protein BC833DRAFT_606836 [Globomyces pollinis-pini]|nr:hypothetical protein BC833DRAFT_606836 [Globomyces pollinis-pini]